MSSSIYSNNKFRAAHNQFEEAEREQHSASLEHLQETLHQITDAILELSDKYEGQNKTFFMQSMVREAMQEAINTREATANYSAQLLMEI